MNLRRDLFVAEQTLVLVRVAADTGARRGELAALRMGDLDGRVLRIERGVSGGVLGSTKTKRARRITLGTTTTEIICTHTAEFPGDSESGHDWLFSPDATRSRFARAERLSHRFDRVKAEAGIDHASLHRFRHSVATYLVGRVDSSLPSTASATGTPVGRCATTRTRWRSKTTTSPTISTPYSTPACLIDRPIDDQRGAVRCSGGRRR